jgi:hypothetical protein
VQRRGLREGRSAAACQNAGKTAAGRLEKLATIDARHGFLPK